METRSKVKFCLNDDPDEDSDRYTFRNYSQPETTEEHIANAFKPDTDVERNERSTGEGSQTDGDLSYDIPDEKVDCINKFIVLPIVLLYLSSFVFLCLSFSLEKGIAFAGDESFILSPLKPFYEASLDDSKNNYKLNDKFEMNDKFAALTVASESQAPHATRYSEIDQNEAANVKRYCSMENNVPKSISSCKNLCLNRLCCFVPDGCYLNRTEWCDEFSECMNLVEFDE